MWNEHLAEHLLMFVLIAVGTVMLLTVATELMQGVSQLAQEGVQRALENNQAGR